MGRAPPAARATVSRCRRAILVLAKKNKIVHVARTSSKTEKNRFNKPTAGLEPAAFGSRRVKVQCSIRLS
jgi:hypothetical protein